MDKRVLGCVLLLVLLGSSKTDEPKAVLSMETSSQGYCLDRTASTSPGAPIQLWECNGSGAQRWTYDPSSGAVYNPSSGKCMAAVTAAPHQNTLAKLMPCEIGDAQAWMFEPAKHWITLRKDRSQCLGHKRTERGGPLVLHRCNPQNEHKWSWPFEAVPESRAGRQCMSHSECGESCCCGASSCMPCGQCPEVAQKNQRVEAQWVDGFWYAGTTTSDLNRNKQVQILFDDGDKIRATLNRARMLRPWPAGSKVQAMKPQRFGYEPATVRHCPDDPHFGTTYYTCQIQFSDGQIEALTLDKLRRRLETQNPDMDGDQSSLEASLVNILNPEANGPQSSSSVPPTTTIQVSEALLMQLIQEGLGSGRSTLPLGEEAPEGSAVRELQMLIESQLQPAHSQRCGLHQDTCAVTRYGP